MTLQISTNTAAARASYNLGKNNSMLQRSFDRLSSGKKLVSPIQDPGSLAVSMKLSAAINRLAGAQNNSQNAMSFLEVQDGMLETVGNIIDRMSELKGLASQDPMKSEQDKASYDNEFRDLQVQLYDIAVQKFNGVSLFANYSTNAAGFTTGIEAKFNAQKPDRSLDNTLTIYTSAEGSEGSKVSVYKSQLLSALTVGQDKSIDNEWTGANNSAAAIGDTNTYLTFASSRVEDTVGLAQLSVNVINQALENIAYLRAQNGGVQSRLSFNLQSLAHQKTNMRAALGRIVDADIAEETTNLSKYQVLSQAAASMLSQANSNTEIALMLLR
ncbi:flagellin [Opitutales bacterium]|nr:flagellin [Opitutales bacterium]